ncbi:MAG TPA: class I SAM-dependent methyltransferase [Gemmatimonadales bacterium]|nr:class I SAM-dependent methyltransferase [Gemmatimonadales bacterium]
MSCCAFDESVDEQFTRAKARAELREYREKGVNPTTRLLLEGLGGAGLIEGTILDIGAGVGALTFEALDRGCRRAIIVDASSAYLAAASEEAGRRGRTSDVRFTKGDFVAVSDQVPQATIVTLDRVVCCYPSYQDLLGEALRHAETAIALSYPRERWYVRLFQWVENASRRWQKNRFTTFVHPEAGIRAMIEGAGFRLVSRSGTLVWLADVYRRAE